MLYTRFIHALYMPLRWTCNILRLGWLEVVKREVIPIYAEHMHNGRFWDADFKCFDFRCFGALVLPASGGTLAEFFEAAAEGKEIW
ncbi:hypothetical protein CLV42_1058 [Chitinophaga ginsengisoli]|uniref:Uncharacterized protein n=1 Tax=Chitinophaga ginsengisoli TaxID=363837 RepID=A0A2P8G9K1_9BACT|nr:hypothetical protein CLV42_1058 [Chitinophaga ginsengisoli]